MKDESEAGRAPETKESAKSLRGFLIILTMAVLFLCYGLFMFFTVGDKGPPRWDFGVVEDIPGESVYSTHSFGAPAPDPQHVSQKPPQAPFGEGRGKNP